jgi:hypothetical protein
MGGIFFSLIGVALIITGVQNTYADAGSQLKGDLTGQNNFTYWIAAILFVGVLGYVPALNRFSHWFLALILLSLFLSHKGFFSSIQAALAAGPSAPKVAGQGQAPLGSTVAPNNTTSGFGFLTSPDPMGAAVSQFRGLIPKIFGGSAPNPGTPENIVPNSATLPF